MSQVLDCSPASNIFATSLNGTCISLTVTHKTESMFGAF